MRGNREFFCLDFGFFSFARAPLLDLDLNLNLDLFTLLLFIYFFNFQLHTHGGSSSELGSIADRFLSLSAVAV